MTAVTYYPITATLGEFLFFLKYLNKFLRHGYKAWNEKGY